MEELEPQQETKISYRRDMLKGNKDETPLSTKKYGFIRL